MATRKEKPLPGIQDTLFTSEEELQRKEAILAFVREFRRQLRTAKGRTERREIRTAISSYLAQLSPAQ